MYLCSSDDFRENSTVKNELHEGLQGCTLEGGDDILARQTVGGEGVPIFKDEFPSLFQSWTENQMVFKVPNHRLFRMKLAERGVFLTEV